MGAASCSTVILYLNKYSYILYSFCCGLSTIHVSILGPCCVINTWPLCKANQKNPDVLSGSIEIHWVWNRVFDPPRWGMSLSSGIYRKRQQSQKILKPFSGWEISILDQGLVTNLVHWSNWCTRTFPVPGTTWFSGKWVYLYIWSLPFI